MIDSLKLVSAAASPCKICGDPAALYGVVDFHKTCEEDRGIRFALSGVPIYYRRCADAFDDWSTEQFKIYIYNDEYSKVDPDYQRIRPHGNAEAVARLWGPFKAETRVLDYGRRQRHLLRHAPRRRLSGGSDLRSDGAGICRAPGGNVRPSDKL